MKFCILIFILILFVGINSETTNNDLKKTNEQKLILNDSGKLKF